MTRAAAFVLLLVFGTGGRPDEITEETALAVGRWTAAVRGHEPGHADAAAGKASAMTFEQRRELDAGMALFLNALTGKRASASTKFESRIVDLARATRQTLGAESFLKRAAVLHGDAALQNEVDGVEPEPSSGSPDPPGRAVSPLLSRKRMYVDKDGEIHGEVLADWNWTFARSLLDLLPSRPADPFVAMWYHATTAFMLKTGLYGEVSTHLQRAAAVLPDEPVILFDSASYAEIQGLPVIQVLMSDDDEMAQLARRDGRRSLIATPPQGGARLGIPLREITNGEAERLFRRVLRADPSFVEARVRLARLLDVRKRHEEAAAELSTALAAKPSGVVAFYAHLFAGRTARTLGKGDEARAHFQAAGSLFPGAQSALLAESQAALLGADLPSTLDPIARLDRSSAARDPWWQYNLASGRDADALLHEMWNQVLRF